MTTSSIMWAKLCKLGVLYLVQGIPYGLQARFLPLYLRTHGSTLTNIGLLKLVLTPWLLKALWAPLVDKYGTKRHWLMGSMSMIAIICYCCSSVTTGRLPLLFGLMIVMNICVSTQDVAVDAIAIDILESGELAHGNMVQVVAYKLGTVFGGGVLVMLSASLSWASVFYLLSSVYLLTVIWICTLDIGTGSRMDGPHKHYSHFNESNKQPSFIWKDVLKVADTLWLLGFLLIYKLGETGALNMVPLFLSDHGYGTRDIGFWTGIVGDVLSITGSLLGGQIVCHYRSSLHHLLQSLCLCRFLGVSCLLVITLLWSSSGLSTTLHASMIIVMLTTLFLSGLTTTATFTMMMRCSQRAPLSIQATHYTLLATAEVLVSKANDKLKPRLNKGGRCEQSYKAPKECHHLLLKDPQRAFVRHAVTRMEWRLDMRLPRWNGV